MPRKGHSNEAIVTALRQVEAGEKVSDVCRRLGVSEQSFYRWKKQSGRRVRLWTAGAHVRIRGTVSGLAREGAGLHP